MDREKITRKLAATTDQEEAASKESKVLRLYQRCCIPSCRSNLDRGEGKSVSVFSFPKEYNRQQAWLAAINRPNYIINRKSGLCENHFEPNFVIRQDNCIGDDGTILTISRIRARLTAHAYPTLELEGPSSTSNEKEGDDNESEEEIVRIKEEIFLTDFKREYSNSAETVSILLNNFKKYSLL